MVIATRRLGGRRIDDRRTAVEGLRPIGREEVRLVRVVRRHAHSIVVMGPPRHLPVAADALPRVARVVRPEKAAAVGRLAIGSWDAVTRLDLGVDAVRHRLADSEADLTDGLGGKTAGELLPR